MLVLEGRHFEMDLVSFIHKFGTDGQPPVAIFDFDGVLCSPTEDLAYKLPEFDGERRALTLIAQRHAIDASLYDTPYLRHLVLQATMHENEIIPDPGPALPLARQLTDAGQPLFVLTARSGMEAIDRVLMFMGKYHLKPQEIFFVGRVAKGRQLSMLRQTISPSRTIVYFEDNFRHARNSRAQTMQGFETVHISWDESESNKAESLVERMLLSPKRITNVLSMA